MLVLGQRIHFKQYCEFLERGFRSRNPKNCWRKFETHCRQSQAGPAPHTSHARQTPIPEDPCQQQVAQCHPLGEWSPGIASSYLCPPPPSPHQLPLPFTIKFVSLLRFLGLIFNRGGNVSYTICQKSLTQERKLFLTAFFLG